MQRIELGLTQPSLRRSPESFGPKERALKKRVQLKPSPLERVG